MAVQEEEIVFDGTWRDRLSHQIRVNRALQVATRPVGTGKDGMLTGEEMTELNAAYDRKEQPEAFALRLANRDAAAFLDRLEPIEQLCLRCGCLLEFEEHRRGCAELYDDEGEHPDDEARDALCAEMGVEI